MKIHTKILIVLFSTFYFLLSGFAFASETNGTIVSGGNNGYAWSNQIGWVNFGCSNCGISITDSGITGYAWNNNYGWINMKPTNGGVIIAANGAFSDYAWGSGLGWINFSGVSINSAGKFIGQASGTTVGALTFDCANCSVVTDWRPLSSRSASTNPGSGAVLIETVTGPSGQSILAHINAFDAPLRILPVQSGVLTQTVNNQKSIILDAPNNVHIHEIIFIAKVLGDGLFDVTAWDNVGNSIRALLKPVKIILTIPKILADKSDLGVYFFNEETKIWVKIPEAVFSGDTVSFYVNHLTRFGIFSSLASEVRLIESPAITESLFPLSVESILPMKPIEEQKTEIVSEEKPTVLFDVQTKPIFPSAPKNWKIFLLIIGVTIILTILIYIFIKFYKK